MLKPAVVMERLEKAIQEAREFFAIDPLYDIELIFDGGSDDAADIDAGTGYLRASIHVNLDYYQTYPDYIRRDMAHEVSHLMSNELLQLRKRLPEEWRDDEQPAGGLFSDAIETLCVRLERLFLRERPEEPTP